MFSPEEVFPGSKITIFHLKKTVKSFDLIIYLVSFSLTLNFCTASFPEWDNDRVTQTKKYEAAFFYDRRLHHGLLIFRNNSIVST
jgi:hypothetical protein